MDVFLRSVDWGGTGWLVLCMDLFSVIDECYIIPFPE